MVAGGEIKPKRLAGFKGYAAFRPLGSPHKLTGSTELACHPYLDLAGPAHSRINAPILQLFTPEFNYRNHIVYIFYKSQSNSRVLTFFDLPGCSITCVKMDGLLAVDGILLDVQISGSTIR